MIRSSGAACAILVLAACGGAPPPRRAAPPAPLQFPGVILEVLAVDDPSWERPTQEIGVLEADARQARGEAKIWANQQLALACLWASESAPSARVAKMQRRCAVQAARSAARGALPPRPAAMMGIVELWALWRGGDRGIERVAERFVERHGTERTLLGVLWVLRGEMEHDRERWEQAARAYRFVVAELDHPLYAVALYRTAHCWREMGRADDARSALREVAARTGTSAPERRLAVAARAELRR